VSKGSIAFAMPSTACACSRARIIATSGTMMIHSHVR
jgi:hypothetical protein